MAACAEAVVGAIGGYFGMLSSADSSAGVEYEIVEAVTKIGGVTVFAYSVLGVKRVYLVDYPVAVVVIG